MPSKKYISIKEAKFVNSNKPGREGATYATEGDAIVTICVDNIVSIHSERIQYSHHCYCIVTLTNGFRYKITETTADAIRLYLDIDNCYERGEE